MSLTTNFIFVAALSDHQQQKWTSIAPDFRYVAIESDRIEYQTYTGSIRTYLVAQLCLVNKRIKNANM